MPHAARQPRSWLIFDVRQKTTRKNLIVTPIGIEVQSASQSQQLDAARPQLRLGQMLRVFGIILCLGGLGHSAGVARYYARDGIPEVNRVLLDVWIAEAQLMGGALAVSEFVTSR